MQSANESVDSWQNFNNRQKNLDAQLDAIEKSLNKHKNHANVPKLEDLSNCSQSRNKIKGYRGRQSIFKRPQGPAPRTCKVSVIPDYRKNPKKWKCYNLDDVSDISNESNNQTAFDFLKELKERKDKKIHKLLAVTDQCKLDDEMEVDDKKNPVISFKKPIKKKELVNKPKAEFKDNKIVMPEYEVGTKRIQKKKNPRNNIQKIDKSKEMKLDHLLSFDDDDEDED